MDKFYTKIRMKGMVCAWNGRLEETATVNCIGLQWKFATSRDSKYLVFHVSTTPLNQMMPYDLKARVSFHLRHVVGAPLKRVLISKPNVTFSSDANRTMDRALFQFESSSEHIRLPVECRVTVFATNGVRATRHLDFSVPQPDITDVTLIVEETRFHVGKSFLAHQSPYFRAMFFSGFQEGGMDEIRISDCTADVFQDVLQILHHAPRINVNNVEPLLAAAQMMDLRVVKEKCEQEILGAPQKLLCFSEQIILADRYQLDTLMRRCLNKIEDSGSLAGVPLASLDERTLKLILDRVLTAESNETRVFPKYNPTSH